MAFYLNTAIPANLFKKNANDRFFVDKSMMIEKISEKIGALSRYICITRPRRFGKTMNASMLAAYYGKNPDTRTLFDHLKISKTENYKKHINQYNIIYIDLSKMPDGCSSYEDYIGNIQKNLREDIKAAFPLLPVEEYRSLGDMLEAVGESFLFILDEWDAIFYERFMGETERQSYMKFLKNLLKDRSYVELAYMTGVLAIQKYSSGSELNMFYEYSFMNDNIYAKYFGFTEEEVKLLCEKQANVRFEELARWYDGYKLWDGESVFNSRSVHEALERGQCQNYWAGTGPMNEIAECVEHNVDEVREDIVRMVAGLPVEVELNGYSVMELELNTRDEILSAMVVYGFLSYYDGSVRIPNDELMEKFQHVLLRDSMGGIKEIVNTSKEMLEATWKEDEQKVAAILESVHDREIPFLMYGDENSLSCVVTLCYLYARKDYRIEREAKSGKGYCDYLFIPKKSGKPAIILELKVGSSCEKAIEQIKSRDYLQKVKHCKDVLLVGLNYDQKKHHMCKIERVSQGISP